MFNVAIERATTFENTTTYWFVYRAWSSVITLINQLRIIFTALFHLCFESEVSWTTSGVRALVFERRLLSNLIFLCQSCHSLVSQEKHSKINSRKSTKQNKKNRSQTYICRTYPVGTCVRACGMVFEREAREPHVPSFSWRHESHPPDCCVWFSVRAWCSRV